MLRMRNILLAKVTQMTNKTLLGFCLLGIGVSLFGLLRWLTGGNKHDEGESEAKRFMMAHEQKNKGFIEKELTDGMNGIPSENPTPIKKYEDDSHFKEMNPNDNSPPTDRF